MKKDDLLFLIQTPYFRDYGPMQKAAGTYFPLGIGYLSASVKARGYRVRFFDPNVQAITPDDIAQAVRAERPTLVGVSFMTPQFAAARQLCDVVKQTCPETTIALGGTHPSVMPDKSLQEIHSADLAVIGEGEETIVEILDALKSDRGRLAKIKGLAWRNGGVIQVNEPGGPTQDLDELPFPDRSLIDQSLYRAQSFLSHSTRTATIYTSRGCPGHCVFCCSGYRLRSRVRERSIENVMREIDELVDSYRIDYLLIKDDTFTIRRRRVEAFCDAIAERHPQLKWHCMGRVDTLDHDLLARMKQAGLHDIFFGIESGNDEILRRCRKGITIAQARRVVEASARLGIASYGAFILGLPGETPATAEETIRFACSLPLTLAGFSVLIPYPGTQAFEDYYQPGPDGTVDYNVFIASTGIHYVREYTGLCGLDPKDLVNLVSAAQRRFYFRPRQVLRMLARANPSMIRGYARGLLSLLAKERYRVQQEADQG